MWTLMFLSHLIMWHLDTSIRRKLVAQRIFVIAEHHSNTLFRRLMTKSPLQSLNSVKKEMYHIKLSSLFRSMTLSN